MANNSPVSRPAPEPPPPAVPNVEPGSGGRGLSNDAAFARPHTALRSIDRRSPEPPLPRKEKPDLARLTGPSPAFQASVLELELDLQNTIARVEAARGKRESDVAWGNSFAQSNGPAKDAIDRLSNPFDDRDQRPVQDETVEETTSPDVTRPEAMTAQPMAQRAPPASDVPGKTR